jgi:hypothetical protein
LPDPHMDKNPLMSRRAVGPAIVRDMIAYIGNRCQDYQLETAGVAGAEQVDQKLCGYLGEAFAVYIVPQLDGLDYPGIKEIYQHLEGYIFLKNSYKDQILSRIRMLYPHIQNWGEKQNPAGL